MNDFWYIICFKVNDRGAVHLLISFIESITMDSTHYINNRTSIKNLRQRFTEESAEKLRSDFFTG